jgi:transposase
MYEIKFWPVEECYIILKTVRRPGRVECLVWSNEGFVLLRDLLDKRAKRYPNEAAAKADDRQHQRNHDPGGFPHHIILVVASIPREAAHSSGPPQPQAVPC